MRIGSLFSGVGGLELGLEWAGLGSTIWQVENNPFCRGILARHWPDVARYEDVQQVGSANLPSVDLLCGGFPCQDVSSAGKGEGLSGSRSGLWFEFARVIKELKPRWVVVENVASGANRWVDRVVAGLEQLEYKTLPIPLSARNVGAPHRRERIFVLGYSDRAGCKRSGQAQPTGRFSAVESAGTGARTANTDGLELRQQQGWGSGTDGSDTGEPGNNGPTRETSNTPGHRRTPERVRAEAEYPDWKCELQYGIETGRIPEPALCRVDDGISSVVGRKRSVAYLRGARRRRQELTALGNAVVPQCAEVVGWVIRELEEA